VLITLHSFDCFADFWADEVIISEVLGQLRLHRHEFPAIDEAFMNKQIKHYVRQVIECLVAGKFVELETLTDQQRLSAKEMSDAISGYGRRLVTPPDNAYDLIDAIEVLNTQPKQWSVIMPLWTHEEGRSDLSVEITLITTEQGVKVELDDIHVL
jgi:hypothetical protein